MNAGSLESLMPRIPRVAVLRRRLHAISRYLHGTGGSNNRYNTSSLHDIKLTSDSSGNSSSIGMMPRSTIAIASKYNATILGSGMGTTNNSKISRNMASAHQHRQLGKDEAIYEPGTRQNEGTKRHALLQNSFPPLSETLQHPDQRTL